jgi:hypothetical protein
MTELDLAMWIITLLVIALVVVPVAVTYLGRALAAARAIERNLADMLDAGVKIAGHSGAIPALDQTIGAAVAMKPVAQNIEAKTAAVASLLASRAAKGGAP